MAAAEPAATQPDAGGAAGRLRMWLVGAVAYVAGRARAGLRRMRGAAFPMLESSVAAALSWVLAADIIGRPLPIVAPIAAWVSLGFKPDRRPRAVAELGAGATLGVLMGDLAARSGPFGPVQLVVLLLGAGLLARFLDSSDTFTMQASINAVIVYGMSSYGVTRGIQDRWIDSLCGAAVAFVFAVLMPRRPTTRAVRYLRSATSELAILLDMLATAMRTGDPARVRELAGQREALGKLIEESAETVRSARSVIGLNPALRAFRVQAEELSRDQRLLKRSLRTTDVIIRQALAMTEDGEAGLSALSVPVGQFAAAVHAIAGNIGAREAPLAARATLLDVAAGADPDQMVGPGGWRSLVLAGIVQSLNVDLLQLTGLSRADARSTLPKRPRHPRPDADPAPLADSVDGSSTVWGGGGPQPEEPGER